MSKSLLNSKSKLSGLLLLFNNDEKRHSGKILMHKQYRIPWAMQARHAGHIRKIRRERGANQKPWITSNDAGGIAGVSAVYAGEENTMQAGLQITNINGSGTSANTATEAFDEPLTMAQVLDIVDPFIF